MLSSQRLPGPKNGLLGLRCIQPFQANALTFLTEMSAYGDMAHFRLGPIPAYCVNDPQLLHQILVEEPEKYGKSEINKRIVGKLMGKGLLLSDGEYWREQRHLLQPIFNHKRVESYAAVMVEQTRRFISTWQDGGTYDISKEMHKLTLAIVAKTIFDINSQSLAERIDSVALNLQKHLSRQSRSIAAFLPLDWLPTHSNRELHQGLDVLNQIIDDIIAERRSSGVDRGDLLSMLLAATSEDGGQMTDQQVHDEAITLFLAGHETSAVNLSWAWYLLAQHPEVYAKLQAEIDALNGQPLTLSDLPKLTYTDWVIRETLRLYPSVYIFIRQANQDTVLGGFKIKKGSLVVFSSFIRHRDGRYFEDPEQFRPERWANNFEKTLPKCAYLPFGAGPRICIGNSFAAMEARLVLATMAQQLRMELVSQQTIRPVPLLALCMSEDAHMRVQKMALQP